MTIRSAIYLAGNKFKLFNSIKTHLQDGKRKTLVDVFGGSGTISINASNEKLFEEYVYNEKSHHLFKLQAWVKGFDKDDESAVTAINKHHKPDNHLEFIKLRKALNEGARDCTFYYHKLYNLMCRSNSNMMRFNSKGEYNMTFGARNRCDVPRILKHQSCIQNVNLRNEDFGDLLDGYLGKDGSINLHILLRSPVFTDNSHVQRK